MFSKETIHCTIGTSNWLSEQVDENEMILSRVVVEEDGNLFPEILGGSLASIVILMSYATGAFDRLTRNVLGSPEINSDIGLNLYSHPFGRSIQSGTSSIIPPTLGRSISLRTLPSDIPVRFADSVHPQNTSVLFTGPISGG